MPDKSKENLTKDVIVHLSKEIETATNNMMAFRTRIGFGVLVGPFLLLASFVVSAKGQPIAFNLSSIGWIALAIDIVCFLGIGSLPLKLRSKRGISVINGENSLKYYGAIRR